MYKLAVSSYIIPVMLKVKEDSTFPFAWASTHTVMFSPSNTERVSLENERIISAQKGSVPSTKNCNPCRFSLDA